MLLATQRPNKLNKATERACFRVQESSALETLSELGVDGEEVADLPLGSFVSMNGRSAGTLRGKLY